VRRTGGVLSLEWSSWKASLEHFHCDTFAVKGSGRVGGEPVTFVLGPDAEVVRLRFLGQEFRRSC
jgi:hypothetical protein